MVSGLLASALLVIWIGIVYGWVLERRAGGLPYEVVVSRSILVAVIVVAIELVLAGMAAGNSFSLLHHVASTGFLAHLALFTAGYLVVKRVPLQPAVTLLAAGVDWLVARQSFWRAYRRRRAGRLFRHLLAERGLNAYR
ncbi:MAG: hypothetical protein ABEI97_01810 [Candidatus Nanohaloarchaea archaeon]